jgi:hypothetical protein
LLFTPFLPFPHFHLFSPHHFHPSFIHSTSSFFHQPHNFHAFVFYIHFIFVPFKLSYFFHALHFLPFTCFSSFFHSLHFSFYTFSSFSYAPISSLCTNSSFFIQSTFHSIPHFHPFSSTPIFIPFTISF